MSFVFDEKTATNSLGETSWATGNRTEYLENWRAALDANYATDRFDSEHNAINKEYSLLVDHLHKKGFSNFDNPVSEIDIPLGPEDPRAIAIRDSEEILKPTKAESKIAFWEKLEELKRNNPDIAAELATLGYDNEENFKNTIGIKAKELWEKHHDISSRSTGWGTFGSFVGAFTALGTDPLVLATLPIGGLYKVGGTVLTQALKVAAVEGIIGTVVEIPIQIKAQGYREEIGLPTSVEIFGKTIPLGVLNTLTVGAGSFVLGGLLTGVIKGTPGAVGSLRKALNKSSDAEIEKITKALKIETPETKLPDNPFEETKATSKINNENHNAAQHQLLNDVKAEIKPIEAELTPKSLDEVKGNVKVYKPEEIEFDPVNFQYKTDGDQRGVSKKLANVQEWDNVAAGSVLVYEFKNGTKAIVDGHQRLGLAKRLSAEGKKIELLAHTFKEVDGVLPEEAMIKGLMVNLMNNTGTAIDAAKIMRSRFGADWSKFSKFLPARSNLVKNTQGLTKLSDDAWGMVINNKNLENLGARVGSIIEDKSLHANIIKILKDKKFTSLAELEQTLRLTNTLPKTVTKQDTLFGTDFFAETLLVERSQMLNWAKKNINKRSAAFKTIIENDTTLQRAGNKLNKLNNEEQRLIYEQVQDRFEQVATQAGSELSARLTSAAKLLKDGKRADAEKLFQQAIDDAAAKGDFRGSNVSQSFGANKTEIETPEISKKFEEDLNTNKLFDEPKKGYTSEDASITDAVLGDGISKAINDEVGKGGIVSTSPAVKSLSISQDLVAGSQRTKATPPSTVFADATASPPSFRGSDNKVIGSTSDISKRVIYHSTDDINTLKQLAKKNYDGYLDFLNKFKKKHNANIDISIKDDASLAKKLQTRKIEEVSDLLRARIDVDEINQARAVAQDIKGTVKTIEFDDFLKTNTPRSDSGYRGIHMQLLTKDGMTVELQIRLKSTSEILTRSHKLYKMKASDFKTAKGLAAFENAKDMIRMELDDAWFRALQKQGLASDELIDQPIHVGTYINEAGEEMDIIKPVREFLEEDTKELNALTALKDCPGIK